MTPFIHLCQANSPQKTQYLIILKQFSSNTLTKYKWEFLEMVYMSLNYSINFFLFLNLHFGYSELLLLFL